MKRSYELQSKAFKNAWVIYRKNYGRVSWSKSCKLGWDLAKKGILLKNEPVKELTAELVYKEYYNDIFQYILKRVFYRAEIAEDITSEAFVKICANLDKFDSTKSKLSTWLITIAKNVMIDRSRSKSERNNSNIDFIDGYVDSEGNPTYQVKSDTLTPEQTYENKELLAKLHNVINGLSDKYREVAIMRLIDGMSYNEISEMLHIPLNRVKIHILRAKQKIKAEMLNVGVQYH